GGALSTVCTAQQQDSAPISHVTSDYQALHHFVAVSAWDWRPVRRRLAEVMTASLQPTAWVVDDTGFPKDGRCSVGVQRQYSGTLGKRANCQLGVSVDAVTEQASCPLDWRLFVPE